MKPSDALAFAIELEHDHVEFVADLELLGGVIDPAPGHVGDVQQAVDPAEVDECAVLGEVLDHAAEDLALLEVLQRLLLLLAFSSSSTALRESTMLPRRLLTLITRMRNSWPRSTLEVAHRAHVHQRSGQERRDADVDLEPALDAVDHPTHHRLA